MWTDDLESAILIDGQETGDFTQSLDVDQLHAGLGYGGSHAFGGSLLILRLWRLGIGLLGLDGRTMM